MQRLSLLLLPLLLATLSVRSAEAQLPGQAGIFADAAGTQLTLDVLPNVPYFVYAVAFDLEGGLLAYEVGLDGVPVGTFALSTTLFGPAPLNVGDAATFNYIVGTGGCVEDAGPLPLVTWNFLSTVAPAADTRLQLRGTNPSSFGGAPGYAKCDESIDTFEFGANGGALILNATFDPPQPSLPARIVLGTGEGELGQIITVPVGIGLTQLKRADPSQLAGIDLEIAFDPAVVELADVRLGTSNADWLLEFNPQVGSADIATAGTSAVAIPGSGEETFLFLDFRALTVEGFSSIDVTSSRLFDLQQQALPHNATDGQVLVNCDKADPVEDDEINTADAIRTLLTAVDLYDPTPLQFCAADVNDDDIVDVGDAILVLQAAVGLYDPTAAREPSDPSVYLRAGDLPGEMLLFYDDLAGLDARFSFDPKQVSFRSVSGPTGGPLVVANGGETGRVHIGSAGTETGAGMLSVRFDVNGRGAKVDVESITAFDAHARRTPLKPAHPEFFFGITGVDGTPGVGRAVELLGARPNPFNPRTELRFRLAAPADVRIGLYDAAGRLVREILRNGASAGEQSVLWDGTDDDGRRVASGVYQVVVHAAGETARGRVTLLK